MDDYFRWSSTSKTQRKEKTYGKLIEYLQTARNKLTPIIDKIVTSTVECIEKGENRLLKECTLTTEQLQDVIGATQTLREVEYKYYSDYKGYTLPNASIIVNNVSVTNNGKMTYVKDKSVVIDEAIVMELLQIYEQMGVVIQKMIIEGTKVSEEPKPKSIEKVPSSSKSKDVSEGSILKQSFTYTQQAPTTNTELHEVSGANNIDSYSGSEGSSDRDLNPPKNKSTLSALLDSSSGDSNKKTGEKMSATSKTLIPSSVPTDEEPEATEEETDWQTGECDEPTVYIKIQCFSDYSDEENTPEATDFADVESVKECSSHYRVTLDGEPVTFKVDKNRVEEGAIYRINMGGEEGENDIRIVIKQCPQCLSTVIGSTSKIDTAITGESHESITLHGKGGDESKMAFSASDIFAHRHGKDKEICQCHRKGKDCKNVSHERCDENTWPCRCSQSDLSRLISEQKIPGKPKLPSKRRVSSESEVLSEPEMSREPEVPSTPEVLSEPEVSSEHEALSEPEEPKVRSQPKIDVLIDAESVDRSKVQIRDDLSEEHVLPAPTKEESKKNLVVRKEPGLLQRRRICSSMEFDVTKVGTRLRDEEIHHDNARIVVELKKLGVDQLLRASRPAKCCRKAILNERQRTALPYCVSLRSLPLMGNDAEVIKQSIEMSVKKIKNSLDLTQAYKDKMAFYVSLGRDDFKPDENFPWVIPVYDLKCGDYQYDMSKFFMLRKTVRVPKQLGSVTRLLGIINNRTEIEKANTKTISRKKYFILKKRNNESVNSSESQVIIRRRFNVCNQKTKRRKIKPKVNKNQICPIKTLKRDHGGSIHKRINVWNKIGDKDWRFIFAQDDKQISLSCVDFYFGQQKLSNLLPKESLNYIDFYFGQKNVKQRGNFPFGPQPLSKLISKPNILYQNFSPPETTNESKRKNCVVNSLASGDYTISSLKKRLEQMNENIKKFKNCLHREGPSNEICKGRSLSNAKSMPSFWKHISEELFYTSGGVTLFVKRTQSLERIHKRMQSSRVHKTEKSEKNNLEYFVDLINGNLIWSNIFPFPPQSYKTYYNYNEHENKGGADRSENASAVEEPIFPEHVTREEAQRGRSTASRTLLEPQDHGSRSTISEINTQELTQLLNAQMDKQQKEKRGKEPNRKPQRLPPSFASFSMGPENQNTPWAPHVVSEISLPQIYEIMGKEELEAAEAKRVPPEPEEKPPSKCSSKPICVKNKCIDCKKKACEKRCHQRDIRIAIKRVRGRGIHVQGTAPKPCTKEICELYKNEKLIKKKSGGKVEDDDPPCNAFSISGKDNIEIYINNEKICLGKIKDIKSSSPKGPKETIGYGPQDRRTKGSKYPGQEPKDSETKRPKGGKFGPEAEDRIKGSKDLDPEPKDSETKRSKGGKYGPEAEDRMKGSKDLDPEPKDSETKRSKGGKYGPEAEDRMKGSKDLDPGPKDIRNKRSKGIIKNDPEAEAKTKGSKDNRYGPESKNSRSKESKSGKYGPEPKKDPDYAEQKGDKDTKMAKKGKK